MGALMRETLEGNKSVNELYDMLLEWMAEHNYELKHMKKESLAKQLYMARTKDNSQDPPRPKTFQESCELMPAHWTVDRQGREFLLYSEPLELR